MANQGRAYEEFVRSIQQAIIDSDGMEGQHVVVVEIDKKIIDKAGIERQFDLYWEYELGGITYKTVIECKDYSRKISVEKIDGFLGKLRDFPEFRGVFATRRGYQSGAEKKALAHNIELLVVREQNDSDWTDEDGTPYLKSIGIQMEVQIPARINEFQPFLDKQWVESETSIDTEKPMEICSNTSEVVIEDMSEGKSYSLQEYEQRLPGRNPGKYGNFEIEETFEEAFIHAAPHGRLKLKAFKVSYSVSPPYSMNSEIDFSKGMIGVVEYLLRGKKSAVFNNRVIKNW